MATYDEFGYPAAIAEKIEAIVATGTKYAFKLERPFSHWSLQVYGRDAMGDPQAASAWTVNLKGGYDEEKAATMITHSNSADSDGDLKAVEGFPAQYIEVDVAALTLGSAAEIVVVLMGVKE